MADYTKEPRITSSRKDCFCSETKQPIKKGGQILFVPESKSTYCKDSNNYVEHLVELNTKNKGGSK